MNTVSRAASVESLKIHYALESDNKDEFHNALQEVHASEKLSARAEKSFQVTLNKDLQDVLPQMSLTWAQEHQSDLAKLSNDSGNISRQGIADYEISTRTDPTHSFLDKTMADSLRQNWDKYSNQGDSQVKAAWDSILGNKHLNPEDIEAALAPMKNENAARLSIADLAKTPGAEDSLFRKLSENGDGQQITPVSLRNALGTNDPRFIDDRERSSAQYLLDHYEDFDKYSGGRDVEDPGIYRSNVTGEWQASNYYHVPAPISADTLNQYAQAKFDQPASAIVHNTDLAEAVSANGLHAADNISKNAYDSSCGKDMAFNCGDSAIGARTDGHCKDEAVPEQMYAAARVQEGEGFYQAAQRMLGANASAEEVLGLAHEFKGQFACDNNNADPAGLRVGYNLLDGYNRDDWNHLVTKYPSLQTHLPTDLG